jgi:hypothetical protein
MKFRVPELLLGSLLTVAVLSLGMLFVPQSNIGSAPASDHEEKADDKVARYTLYLAILTGGLVAVSAFQGYFLLRADKTARMSADAAQAQTINFTKLERPYIYIFNPQGLFFDEEREDPFHYLKYAVANYGKTPATIDAIFTGINAGPSPGELSQWTGWHQLLVSPILTPNQTYDGLEVAISESIRIGEYADEDTTPTDVPELADGEEFFFQVRIKYHGPFSSHHETAACWRWHMSGLRLVSHNDKDYSFMR